MADTWISKTGQRWKVHIFWLVFSIGAFLLIAFIRSTDEATSPNPLFAAGFVTFTVLSLVWLFASVRCPRCAGRPAWWIVRYASANDWFVLIAGMADCPICHDRGIPSAGHGNGSESTC